MKRAIVLAGGGAKGSYHIGFWKALNELGIEYQITTGSSVGALNAALFAIGDYEKGVDMWSSIRTEDIVTKSPSKLSQMIDTDGIANSLRGIFGEMADDVVNVKMDPFPLSGLLSKTLSEQEVRDSGVEVGIMCAEYPSMRPHPVVLSQIPYGMMKDYLLASSTVFPSMEPKTIAGINYVDGGYTDNFPVNLALDMGAEEIIGCKLRATGVESKYQSNYPIRVIEPHFSLGASMTFDQKQSKFNQGLGYNDTMRNFGYYDGSCYTFKKGEREIFNRQIAQYFSIMLVKTGVISQSEKDKFYSVLSVKAFADARKVRFGRMYEELAMVSAESAGELLEVEPLPIYDHEGFASEVLKAYEKKKIESEQVVKNLSAAKTLVARTASLKNQSRVGIMAYLAEKISANIFDKSSEAEFKAFCRTVPEEFFGALYVDYIRKYGE